MADYTSIPFQIHSSNYRFCPLSAYVIEDEEVKKILKHLGLWERKERPPPRAIGPPKSPEYTIDYSISQLPYFPDLVSDEVGSESDNWLYVDPEYPELISGN